MIIIKGDLYVSVPFGMTCGFADSTIKKFMKAFIAKTFTVREFKR